MQVVVTGYPHSGSSSVATALQRAGLDLGVDAATAGHGCGRTGDPEVRRLHRAILERHGADVPATAFPFFVGRDHWRRMRELARRRDLAHDDWGFEDPRAVAFLGAWKHALPDARFVVVHREPGACLVEQAACPAGHPDAGDPDLALRRWDARHRAVLSFARAHPEDCLVLAHDDAAAATVVRDRFGLPLAVVAVDADVAAPVAAVAPSADAPHTLRSDTEAAARAEQTWRALTDLSARTEPA